MSQKPTMLTDDEIRASWEVHRESMRSYLLNRKPNPFNPKSVEKVITNFIESAVFAKLPNQSIKGIAAAWHLYKCRQTEEEKTGARRPQLHPANNS